MCCYNAILDSSHTHTRTYLANIHFGDARDMTLECIGTAIHFLSHGDGDGVGVEDCGFFQVLFLWPQARKDAASIALCKYRTTVPQYHRHHYRYTCGVLVCLYVHTIPVVTFLRVHRSASKRRDATRIKRVLSIQFIRYARHQLKQISSRGTSYTGMYIYTGTSSYLVVLISVAVSLNDRVPPLCSV